MIMEDLNQIELEQLRGGEEPAFYHTAAYIAGHALGKGVDLLHGLWDGLMGVDAH